MVPFVHLCQQLPISLNTIINNRFILYFIQAFPIQLLSLSSFYFFIPELESQVNPLEYIAFMVFWLSFGIYAGFVSPASDIGLEMKATEKKGLQALYFIAFFAIVIALFTGFHLIFKHGFVYWTLKLAIAQPVLVILISILLAWLGIIYWKRKMRKTLRTIDYF